MPYISFYPYPDEKRPYPKNGKIDISSKLPKSASHPKIDNQAKPSKFIIIKNSLYPPKTPKTLVLYISRPYTPILPLVPLASTINKNQQKTRKTRNTSTIKAYYITYIYIYTGGESIKGLYPINTSF